MKSHVRDVAPFLFLGFLVANWMTPSMLMAQEERPARSLRVYVGTYTNTDAGSQGLYCFELDPQTGKPGPVRVVAELVNPSFLAFSPDKTHLYAVNEVSDVPLKKGERGVGSVTAFEIDSSSGDLTKLNTQPSGGAGACHVAVDHSGRNALVANYGGGNAACLPIAKDGSLKPPSSIVQHAGSSVNLRRQSAPHAHSINVSPDNRFAFVADLGLDQIRIYQFDSQAGTLAPHDPAFVETRPGAGPRHFAFHPNGKYAYNNNELDWTVVAYAYEAKDGSLRPIDVQSTLQGETPTSGGTAETLVHPSGNFVYVSNRGPDDIAIFQIRADGTLKPAGFASTQGKTPRNFGIDPSGRFLLAANQQSDTIVIFRIDQETGALDPTGDVVEVPAPACVRMLAAP